MSMTAAQLKAEIEAGYQDFATRWNPIFDAFDASGVLFALEVHPTEIAYDIHTARHEIQRSAGQVHRTKLFSDIPIGGCPRGQVDGGCRRQIGVFAHDWCGTSELEAGPAGDVNRRSVEIPQRSI